MSESSEISQREYFERVIREVEKRVEDRFAAQALALKLQADLNDARIGTLSSGQAALVSDRDRYMLREVSEGQWTDLNRWRDQITQVVSSISGRDKGISVAWAAAVAVVGILFTAAMFFRHG